MCLNTSIKFDGGVSHADANALAPNMGTTRDFHTATRKRKTETDFAVYIRNETHSAITLTVPFGTLEDMSRMSEGAFAQLTARNRKRYSAGRTSRRVKPAETDVSPPSSISEAEQRAPDGDNDDWRS